MPKRSINEYIDQQLRLTLDAPVYWKHKFSSSFTQPATKTAVAVFFSYRKDEEMLTSQLNELLLRLQQQSFSVVLKQLHASSDIGEADEEILDAPSRFELEITGTKDQLDELRHSLEINIADSAKYTR